MKKLLVVSVFLFSVLGVLNLLGLKNTVVLLCDAAAFPSAGQLFLFGLYLAAYLGAQVIAPACLIAAALLSASFWMRLERS